MTKATPHLIIRLTRFPLHFKRSAKTNGISNILEINRLPCFKTCKSFNEYFIRTRVNNSFNVDGIRYAIRADVDGFDYDALIADVRNIEMEDRKITLWPLASTNDYDRQWSVDLHALARGIVYVSPVMIMFASAAVAAP